MMRSFILCVFCSIFSVLGYSEELQYTGWEAEVDVDTFYTYTNDELIVMYSVSSPEIVISVFEGKFKCDKETGRFSVLVEYCDSLKNVVDSFYVWFICPKKKKYEAISYVDRRLCNEVISSSYSNVDNGNVIKGVYNALNLRRVIDGDGEYNGIKYVHLYWYMSDGGIMDNVIPINSNGK